MLLLGVIINSIKNENEISRYDGHFCQLEGKIQKNLVIGKKYFHTKEKKPNIYL